MMYLSGDLHSNRPASPILPEVRKTTPLDPAEILKRLKELHEAKLLTDEEYQARIKGFSEDEDKN